MAHLREIGIKSISNARRGKMPVVDSKTGESIGSISVNHPKVLSGEWQHHSKGKPAKVKPSGAAAGKDNGNYKELTEERRHRLFDCVAKSIIDEYYFSMALFVIEIKKEFTEFKKISFVWVKNNFGSTKNFVDSYNLERHTDIKFSTYYRGTAQRDKLSKANLKNDQN